MKLRKRTRLAFVSILVFAGVFLILRSRPPESYFEKPQAHFREQTIRFHQKVAACNGMEVFWTFDDPEGLSSSGEHSYAPEVKLTSGARGGGRSFTGDDSSWMQTDHVWSIPADISFSIAFRVKIRRFPAIQDVFCIHVPQGDFGFRLEDGRFAFRFPSKDGDHSVSCDFDQFDRFVHVAVVSNPLDGKTVLYLDGEPVASVDAVSIPLRIPILFGRALWETDRAAFHGILDDVGIWNRSLSSSEVRRNANNRFGLDRALAPGSSWVQWWSRKIRLQCAEAIGRFVHAPIPWRDVPRAIRASRIQKQLPVLSLVIANADARHLTRSHARSVASGLRTEAAATPVPAFLHFQGHTQSCKVSLSGGTLCYPNRTRPGYLILPAETGKSVCNGASRLEVLPPETSGWLFPMMQSGVWNGLPGLEYAQCQLVRFRVNGLDQGVFLARTDSRMAVVPGSEESVLFYHPEKQMDRQRSAELHRLSPSGLSGRTQRMLSLCSESSLVHSLEISLRNQAEAIWNDVRSPVPRIVRDAALRKCFDQWHAVRIAKPQCAEDALLDEFLLLGSNVSPDRITEDLGPDAVRALLPSGWNLALESHAPEFLNDAGHLLQRPHDGPCRVQVTAVLTDANGTKSQRDLSFRIMPPNGPLPSLFVWTGERMSKTHRTDAMLELYDDAHENKPQWRMSATAAANGGIQYRGNSSFRMGKRLINLKTDEPHHWFGESETRSLLAINAGSDFLRVWDTIAFDAFRDFPRPDGRQNFAPRVRIVEMFVNGQYWGPIEFCERVDARLFGHAEKDDHRYIVYRDEKAQPRIPYIRPVFPAAVKGDFRQPWCEVENAFDAGPIPVAPKDGTIHGIDLLSAADLHILFTFFGNPNGMPHQNRFLECLVFDAREQRFSFVPWDFDRCLCDEPLGFVHSGLTRQLLKDSSAFRSLLAARWDELRAGPLSESVLVGRFDALVSQNLPYLPFEFERWPQHSPSVPLRDVVSAKRKNLLARYRQMDEIIRIETKSRE